jgi:hypothetical protein
MILLYSENMLFAFRLVEAGMRSAWQQVYTHASRLLHPELHPGHENVQGRHGTSHGRKKWRSWRIDLEAGDRVDEQRGHLDWNVSVALAASKVAANCSSLVKRMGDRSRNEKSVLFFC